MPRNHPDFDALAVLDHILGSGPGFTDRLSRVIRDELGLAYSVGGGITDSADVLPGFSASTSARCPTRPTVSSRRSWNRSAPCMRAILRRGGRTCPALRRRLLGLRLPDRRAARRTAPGARSAGAWGWTNRCTGPSGSPAITPARSQRAAPIHIDPAALVRVEYGPIRRRVENPQAECA